MEKVNKVEELEEKLFIYKEIVDYILAAKPENYYSSKNMLDDFKLVIALSFDED